MIAEPPPHTMALLPGVAISHKASPADICCALFQAHGSLLRSSFTPSFQNLLNSPRLTEGPFWAPAAVYISPSRSQLPHNSLSLALGHTDRTALSRVTSRVTSHHCAHRACTSRTPISVGWLSGQMNRHSPHSLQVTGLCTHSPTGSHSAGAQ